MQDIFTECQKKQELTVPTDAEGYWAQACDDKLRPKLKAAWTCFMEKANADESIDLPAMKEKLDQTCPHNVTAHD